MSDGIFEVHRVISLISTIQKRKFFLITRINFNYALSYDPLCNFLYHTKFYNLTKKIKPRRTLDHVYLKIITTYQVWLLINTITQNTLLCPSKDGHLICFRVPPTVECTAAIIYIQYGTSYLSATSCIVCFSIITTVST